MIVVELTPTEAYAHELTKHLADDQLENALLLDVWARYNLTPAEAAPQLQPLLEDARSARRKIAEATRYEIHIVGAN